MIKISIIMPVYNGSRWLDESINSVLNQTYGDFELICVDDSSTDNSAEIIKQYSLKDNRIKYYLKNNEGPGMALNFGVEKANGEYLCFLDQDDKYHQQYLEKMFNCIEKSNLDVCICNGYWWEDDKLKILYTRKFPKIINISKISKKTKLTTNHLPQWCKIVRKSFWQDNKIKFPSRENKAHDVVVHYMLLGLCDKIGNIQDCIYYHRHHQEQISYNFNSSLYYSKSIETILDWLNLLEISDKRKHIIQQYTLNLLVKRAIEHANNISSLYYIYFILRENSNLIQKLKLITWKLIIKFKIRLIKTKNKITIPIPKVKHLGKNSYCAKKLYITNSNETAIGNFVSIGENVRLGNGTHPLNFLSTSPYFYFDNFDWKTNKTTSHNEFYYCEPIKIGNDVWIGDNVIIKNGITIGDGAVIGMGAVVTKNVPPYAIVGGVPAKIIKYRFNQETVDELLKLKWWDLDDNIIKEIPYENVDEAIKYLKKVRGIK